MAAVGPGWALGWVAMGSSRGPGSWEAVATNLRLLRKVQLVEQCALADQACAARDAYALGRAIRAVVPLVPESLAIDLTAIGELAEYDAELAFVRWPQLRERLVTQDGPAA